MAKNKQHEAIYKEIGLKRIKQRKKARLERWVTNGNRIGSGMYERRVASGEIQTCEWGSSRCDLYGCNGDC